jgi:hypothetical protein
VQTEAGTRADLVRLGTRLAWVGADDKEEPAVEAVMETERTAAENLSEALEGLPLAHEQAGAYCERLHISFAEYQKR